MHPGVQAKDALKVICKGITFHKRVVRGDILGAAPAVLLAELQDLLTGLELLRRDARGEYQTAYIGIKRKALRLHGLHKAQRLLPLTLRARSTHLAGEVLRRGRAGGPERRPERIAARVLAHLHGAQQQAAPELAVFDKEGVASVGGDDIIGRQALAKNPPGCATFDNQREEGRRHRNLVPLHVLQEQDHGLGVLCSQGREAQRQVEAVRLCLRQPLKACPSRECVLVHFQRPPSVPATLRQDHACGLARRHAGVVGVVAAGAVAGPAEPVARVAAQGLRSQASASGGGAEPLVQLGLVLDVEPALGPPLRRRFRASPRGRLVPLFQLAILLAVQLQLLLLPCPA
mmetsp:Transcript_111647/g.315767  ORF Transcript_111647/g.315767 Transcript_111647/m.315767 type:complete len:345 (-) Transcript_111647:192-1226(-)